MMQPCALKIAMQKPSSIGKWSPIGTIDALKYNSDQQAETDSLWYFAVFWSMGIMIFPSFVMDP